MGRVFNAGRLVMKHLLPGKVELVILVTLVIISTAVVAAAPKHDLGLAGVSIPVFIFAAVMGLRRNWQLADAEESDDSNGADVL